MWQLNKQDCHDWNWKDYSIPGDLLAANRLKMHRSIGNNSRLY